VISENEKSEKPPATKEEIEALNRLVTGIVTAQGNRFIKELLREKGIQIGATKTDFGRNMKTAIEHGQLRLSDVENWLRQVEGWGNQHVYLFNLPPALKPGLTRAEIERNADEAGLQRLLGASTAMEFPDEPELTEISLTDSCFSLVWHEASPTWLRVPDLDFRWPEDRPHGASVPKLDAGQEVDLDTYEFRAHRRLERRAVTRFEVRLDLSLAALFIPDPIRGEEHKTAIQQAEEVIAKFLDLPVLRKAQVKIADVSKNLDQANLPQKPGQQPSVKTQRSRLSAGGAYVEFAADGEGHAYWESTSVRDVRKSVRSPQLKKFSGTRGLFEFQKGGPLGLARSLKVELYARDRRIRLWAQMDRDEVWSILTSLSQQQGNQPQPAPEMKGKQP